METIKLTNTAKAVLTALNEIEPVQIKTIQKITEMERMKVLSGLLELELFGIIRQFPGKYFVRIGGIFK